VGEIFANNVAGIDRASIVVASLNGVTTDDGTAWELGYAFASNTYIIGLHTDWRRRFDDEVVNLMLERSCDAMVHSLDELTTHLTSWAPSPE
jgi:nucleoside 2-deoxyribosyltransferase